MDFRPQIDIFWTFNCLHFCWRDIFSGFSAAFWLKKRPLLLGTKLDSLQSTYQSWLRDYTCTTVVHLILTGDHWKLWKLRNSFSEGLFRIANLLILLKSLLDSLPVSLVGMNSNLMCQYIGFVADRLLLPLRCRQREKHVSEYSGGRFLEKLLLRSKAGWLFMYNKSPTHRWLWCIT